MGCGGEVYIGVSGPKGYEKTDTVPVVVIDEENEKAHKTWYITLYNKLFGGKYQKQKKFEKLLISL